MNVHRIRIGFRVNGHRLDAQPFARSHHATGNFPSICNQDFFNERLLLGGCRCGTQQASSCPRPHFDLKLLIFIFFSNLTFNRLLTGKYRMLRLVVTVIVIIMVVVIVVVITIRADSQLFANQVG